VAQHLARGPAATTVLRMARPCCNAKCAISQRLPSGQHVTFRAKKAGLLLLCHQRCAASNSQPPGKQKNPTQTGRMAFYPAARIAMPRFFVDQPLIAGTELSLPDAVVRHVQVLRLNAGDALTVFNGSPPDAFVEGLMEGVIQWDTSDPDVMLAESFKNEIKKASKYNLTEAKLNVFAKYLDYLKG
jgi:hypothetical protein